MTDGEAVEKGRERIGGKVRGKEWRGRKGKEERGFHVGTSFFHFKPAA